MAESSAALRQQLLDLRTAQELVLKAKCGEIGAIMDELNLVNSDIQGMSREEAKWKRRLKAAKKATAGGGGPPTPVAASAAALPAPSAGGAAQQGTSFVKNVALGLFEFNEALSKKR
jgi:hypothetical protein